MPRITISIPVELKRQLTDARVRQSLNVSRVCQAALRREVRKLLELPLDLARLEELLDRLRAERDGLQDRYHGLGAAAARDWVEHLSTYAQLSQLADLPLEERIARLEREPPATLAGLIAQHEGEEGFDPGAFRRGWATALGLLWEVIRKHL
jgi:hypothetical protein